MSKQTALWLLKLCFGLGLLSLLVAKADYSAILEELRSVNLMWLAAVFIVPHISLWISTIKWRALLTCHGSRVGLFPLIKFYLIGTFFNSFLPSMVGGDIVRVHQLRRLEPRLELAIASTFLERFLGFGGLVTLLPLVWLYPVITDAVPAVKYVVVGAIAIYLGAFALLFSPFDFFPPGVPKSALLKRVIGTLSRSRQQVRAYKHHVGILLLSYVISVVFYLLSTTTFWLATKAVGASVSLGFMVSVIPLVLLAAVIPVSVNGLGVLESGTALLLTTASVPLPEAVLVPILLRLRLVFTALLGGILFLLDRSPSVPTPHRRDAAVVEPRSNAQR